MTAVSTALKSPKGLTLFQEIFELGGDLVIEGLSKAQFRAQVGQYPELQMERAQNGNIHIMAPIKGGSGIRENKLNRRIGNFCEKNLGGETFSPSTGFDLPNGPTRSPDSAWVSQEKMESLTTEQIENEFIPVVPDFVVELRSKIDRLKKLKTKMEKTWIAIGVFF